MKNLIVIVCSVVILTGMIPVKATIPGKDVSGESVKVLCSPDVYGLMQKCIASFNSSTGSEAVALQMQNADQLNDWIETPGHLALLTKYDMNVLDPQQLSVFVIGREVYVPIMNPGNPFRKEIMQQGISQKEFARLYSVGKGATWGDILQNNSEKPMHAFRTADPSFTAYLADFTEKGNDVMGGVVLQDCEQVISAVSMDPYGIGFCKLSQLKEMEKDGDQSSLTMVPVDLNDNNRMDHFEEIYGSVQELNRGIWIGKYTGTLYSRIFAVSDKANELGKPERALLQWLIGDGQEVLALYGYLPLMDNEQKTLLARLDHPADAIRPQEDEIMSNFGLVIGIIVVGLGLVLYLVLLILNSKRAYPGESKLEGEVSFVAGSSEIPGGYFFDRSHTWAFQEMDGNVRIGLDSFLEKLTGNITRIELRDRGEHIRKGQVIFTLVQNGKRMGIRSPLSGRIISHNEQLSIDSSLMNRSPFSEGWVYVIEPDSWEEEVSVLLRAPKYKEWIKAEFIRLKDFLANLQKKNTEPLVVLQEGGEVKEGILKDLGPEVWEDFQSDFLRNK